VHTKDIVRAETAGNGKWYASTITKLFKNLFIFIELSSFLVYENMYTKKLFTLCYRNSEIQIVCKVCVRPCNVDLCETDLSLERY